MAASDSRSNHRAWSDREREEHVIERVEGDAAKGYSLSFDRSMGCGMPATDLVVPKVGDSLTLWGKGFGFSFRGQAINQTVVWYRDEIEDRAYHAEDAKKREAEQRADYETKRTEHDAIIAGLPDVFRQRFAGYRQRNPNFGWKFEGYELMACQDAVRIAEALKTPEAIKAFYDMPWEEQKRAVPDLDDGHSGNSFGFACRMASLYLTNPELVPKFHGAMAVLVGSEEYGDWACSEEARAK
jgi:hypothetical protein